ncbi:MAG: isoprenylcysteine carboxylmethyltransferase family protein [Candidatus Lokiarchaeota archaeon]|nr:isoprenylcysteine carboxylmethyltransferase family protein [Candidatus Lokiarchaeota archaeon]
MIEWINFIVLIISTIIFSYLYLLSIQPVKRSESRGEKAWEECARLRIIGSVFMCVTVINFFLWIWFPIQIFNWLIDPNYILGIIIGIIILVIFMPIMIKGEHDAGAETMKPSKDTEMYGGIYNYIRHPQTLGEFPTFIALGFFLNSWFLVIIFIIWIVVYTPIMIYIEEKDLIRRFGDSYRDYQKRTGALIPKLGRKKN